MWIMPMYINHKPNNIMNGTSSGLRLKNQPLKKLVRLYIKLNGLISGAKALLVRFPFSLQRGSCMVWEINMGVCPRLEFDNIMFSNCLGYDFYVYGAFEFFRNSIANL